MERWMFFFVKISGDMLRLREEMLVSYCMTCTSDGWIATCICKGSNKVVPQDLCSFVLNHLLGDLYPHSALVLVHLSSGSGRTSFCWQNISHEGVCSSTISALPLHLPRTPPQHFIRGEEGAVIMMFFFFFFLYQPLGLFPSMPLQSSSQSGECLSVSIASPQDIWSYVFIIPSNVCANMALLYISLIFQGPLL